MCFIALMSGEEEDINTFVVSFEDDAHVSITCERYVMKVVDFVSANRQERIQQRTEEDVMRPYEQIAVDRSCRPDKQTWK